jgi:hypothetical protein
MVLSIQQLGRACRLVPALRRWVKCGTLNLVYPAWLTGGQFEVIIYCKDLPWLFPAIVCAATGSGSGKRLIQ